MLADVIYLQVITVSYSHAESDVMYIFSSREFGIRPGKTPSNIFLDEVPLVADWADRRAGQHGSVPVAICTASPLVVY